MRPAPAHRSVLMAILAACAVIVAGCSHDSGVDEVTVTAGGASVTLPAAMSCYGPTGATRMSCAGGENTGDAPHLSVAPGTPLTVTVPPEVSDAPWVIVFSYVDAGGERQNDRTGVFPPGERSSYQLMPPDGAQLNRLEVQTLTAAPVTGGGVEFPATSTWVLVIDPLGGASSG